MDPSLITVIALGGLIALLLVVGLTYKPDREGESEWAKVAARLGLRFLDRGLPDLEIQGEWEGYELRVSIREIWVSYGKGEALEYGTMVSVRLREEEWERGASLMMENEASAVSVDAEKWLGGYFFSAPPSAQVRETLEKAEVQRILMELVKDASLVHLVSGELKVEQERFISGGEELEAMIRKMKRVAEVLDGEILSSRGAPGLERESSLKGRAKQEEKGVEKEVHSGDGASQW